MIGSRLGSPFGFYWVLNSFNIIYCYFKTKHQMNEYSGNYRFCRCMYKIVWDD